MMGSIKFWSLASIVLGCYILISWIATPPTSEFRKNQDDEDVGNEKNVNENDLPLNSECSFLWNSTNDYSKETFLPFISSMETIQDFSYSFNLKGFQSKNDLFGFEFVDSSEKPILKFHLKQQEGQFQVCDHGPNENETSLGCTLFEYQELKQIDSMSFSIVFDPVSIQEELWNYRIEINDQLTASRGQIRISHQIKSVQFQNYQNKDISNFQFCIFRHKHEPQLHFREKRQTGSCSFSGFGTTHSFYLVYRTAMFQNQLYVGGFQFKVNSIDYGHVARWNGTAWLPLGPSIMNYGADQSVHAFASFQNVLYVAGAFSSVANLSIPANKMAKWDGSTWSPMPFAKGITSINVNSISNLLVSGLLMYACGFFETNATAMSGIAKWDGSNWSLIGGVAVLGNIYGFEMIDDDVFIGGQFNVIGSANSFNNIAKFNGTNWVNFGGVDGTVISLSAGNGKDLYIGGQFTVADQVGSAVNYIAKYNGSHWSNLRTGFSNSVSPIKFFNGNLYIGGLFLLADGMSASYIVGWNGTNYFPLGVGVSNAVFCLMNDSNTLYLGGSFTSVNGVGNYSGIAKYECIYPTPQPTPQPTPFPTPPTPPTPAPTPQPTSTSTENIAISSSAFGSIMIVGIIVGIAVLLCIVLLIVVIILLVKRRGRKQLQNDSSTTNIQIDQYNEKSPYVPLSKVQNNNESFNNNNNNVNGHYASTTALFANNSTKSSKQNSQQQQQQQYATPISVFENSTNQQKDVAALFKKFSIPYSDLKLDRELGKGNFGSVFLAYKKSNLKQPIACKQVANSSSKDVFVNTASDALKKETKAFKDFIAEATVLQSIPPSPYVVGFVGLCSDPFCILTEFIDGGSLLEYLQNANSEFTFRIAISFLKQICRGIAHLHKNGIVHRDLAARNVLLRTKMDQETGVRQCVLVDMGLARLFEDGENYMKTKSPIPLKWTAPEALREKKFSDKSDIYSFGVLAIECFTRDTPFPKMSPLECAMSVSSGKFNPSASGICPDEYVPILNPCFSMNPDERPTALQLINSFDSIKQ